MVSFNPSFYNFSHDSCLGVTDLTVQQQLILIEDLILSPDWEKNLPKLKEVFEILIPHFTQNITNINEGFRLFNLLKNKMPDPATEWESNFKQIEIEVVKAELKIWQENPNLDEAKILAASKILKAFIYNEIALNALNKPGQHKLTSVPNAIAQLDKVEYISFSSNQILFLPDNIGQLRRLQVLDLSFNGLKSLPNTIGKLSKLQYLYLCYNKIESLPDAIGLLGNLRELHLPHNRLQLLPNTIGNLSQLKHLDLSGNRLLSLPETLGKCIKLEYLNLDRNLLLSELPLSFKNFSKNISIYIHKTKINPWQIAQLEELRKNDSAQFLYPR